MHPTLPASQACSMVKRVVAKVAIPDNSRRRHASRPSHVLGILMHTRERSKPKSKSLKCSTIPSDRSASDQKTFVKRTLCILDSLLGIIGVVWVGLDMDEASDMFRDLKLQLDHLWELKSTKCL